MWMFRPTQNLTQNRYVTYATGLEGLLRAFECWEVPKCLVMFHNIMMFVYVVC